MKDGEQVNMYIGRTLSIIIEMKSNGESMNSNRVISKILISLTIKFNYVVCAIEESNDLSTMSLDELDNSLLVHKKRMQHAQQEEHVLKVTYDDRPSASHSCGREVVDEEEVVDDNLFNKALVKCFQCHKLGHYQYECPGV